MNLKPLRQSLVDNVPQVSEDQTGRCGEADLRGTEKLSEVTRFCALSYQELLHPQNIQR